MAVTISADMLNRWNLFVVLTIELTAANVLSRLSHAFLAETSSMHIQELAILVSF